MTYKAVDARRAPAVKAVPSPRVLIPVFPGTNCEYDSARAMERAGAEPEIFVINNLTPAARGRERAGQARRIDAAR